MDILYLLIPLSLILVFLIGAVFWWALQNRQFDDLEEKGASIFEHDDQTTNPNSQTDSAADSGGKDD